MDSKKILYICSTGEVVLVAELQEKRHQNLWSFINSENSDKHQRTVQILTRITD